MSDGVASLIRQIRTLLDKLEQVAAIKVDNSLDLTQWLNLRGYPKSRSDRSDLRRADEQLQAGYTYEQIVQIFRWHNKRTFLPLLKRFCDERTATQSETADRSPEPAS